MVRDRTETRRRHRSWASKRKDQMPRYFFHVRNDSEFIEDPDGTDLPSPDHARQEAILAAREILSERLLKGRPIGGDVFEITSEDGTLVERVPFRSALVE